MPVYDVNNIEKWKNDFATCKGKFNNTYYSDFKSSYLFSSSDSIILNMKNSLSKRYEKINRIYNNITKVWNEYLLDLKNTDNVLAGTASVGSVIQSSVKGVLNSMPKLEEYNASLGTKILSIGADAGIVTLLGFSQDASPYRNVLDLYNRIVGKIREIFSRTGATVATAAVSLLNHFIVLGKDIYAAFKKIGCEVGEVVSGLAVGIVSCQINEVLDYFSSKLSDFKSRFNNDRNDDIQENKEDYTKKFDLFVKSINPNSDLDGLKMLADFLKDGDYYKIPENLRYLLKDIDYGQLEEYIYLKNNKILIFNDIKENRLELLKKQLDALESFEEGLKKATTKEEKEKYEKLIADQLKAAEVKSKEELINRINAINDSVLYDGCILSSAQAELFKAYDIILNDLNKKGDGLSVLEKVVETGDLSHLPKQYRENAYLNQLSALQYYVYTKKLLSGINEYNNNGIQDSFSNYFEKDYTLNKVKASTNEIIYLDQYMLQMYNPDSNGFNNGSASFIGLRNYDIKSEDVFNTNLKRIKQTTTHEVLHDISMSSDDAISGIHIKNEYCGINETITAYATKGVFDSNGGYLAKHTSYEDMVERLENLVNSNVVTEEELYDAYFSNDVEPLKNKLEGISSGSFDKLVNAFNAVNDGRPTSDDSDNDKKKQEYKEYKELLNELDNVCAELIKAANK